MRIPRRQGNEGILIAVGMLVIALTLIAVLKLVLG
jgi:hypothetical protein